MVLCSLIFRSIFHIFGLGSLNASKKIRLTFYTFYLTQCIIILSLLNTIWIGRTSIFSNFDDWTHSSDNLQYFSIIIMDGAVLIESLRGQKRLLQVNALISDIELTMTKAQMDIGKVYEAFQRDALKKFVVFMLIFTLTESSYYFSNFNNSALTKLILLNFYLFLFKHMREFQFIFYIDLVNCHLKMIQTEVRSLMPSPCKTSHTLFVSTTEEFRKHFHLSFETYLKARKLLLKTIKSFHWSTMVIIFQNVIQLLMEIYWISFGIVNAPSKDKLKNFEMWPLIPCLLPKILLPWYMWKTCERCYKLENEIFHVLHSINLRTHDERTVLMVKFFFSCSNQSLHS